LPVRALGTGRPPGRRALAQGRLAARAKSGVGWRRLGTRGAPSARPSRAAAQYDPDRLEDLSFVMDSGRSLLTTISHEQDAYMSL